MQNSDFDLLTSRALEPAFWTPERLGRPSAWWGHVPFAFWLVANSEPRLFVELGTHHGVSYAAFCEAVLRLRLATRCYAVDTWAGDPHAGVYGEDVYTELKNFHDRRYASFSQLVRRTFDEACGDFADGSIDLLHIDGFHTYEAVRHDFETWRPKLSSRAVALFHDTNERQRDFGVRRFLDELKQDAPVFEFLHGHGLGVVAVGLDAPESVKRLCRLTKETEIAALRERFSLLGARWLAEQEKSDLIVEARQLRQAITLKDARSSDLEQSVKCLEQSRMEKEQKFVEFERHLQKRQEIINEYEQQRTVLCQRIERDAIEHVRALAGLKRPEYTGRLPRKLSGLRWLIPWRRKKLRRLASEYGVIAASPLFDSKWYLSTNADVAHKSGDPALHYLLHGARQGRAPGQQFNGTDYLEANPDLAVSQINPLVHYTLHGVKENRALGRVQESLSFNNAALRGRLLKPQYIRSEIQQRLESVDIIICVHNALEVIRRCLESVIAKTLPPYNIVLVDDGSDAPTRDFLSEFAETFGATLVRHESPKGYTFAANAGMRACAEPFLVLLNSDTEVSEGWLDRLMDHLRRDPSAGMIGPLSNTASWQSVPSLFEEGDWAQNQLPSGVSVDEMARLVALKAPRIGVSLGFLNGFCILIRRRLLDEVGMFDEQTFGAGYGEENDLCIRARRKGWRLLVADDAYVFHHQSRSYGDRRRELTARADQTLAEKHSDAVDIAPYVSVCRNSLQLRHARLRIACNQKRKAMSAHGRADFETRRIAFVLPVGEAGGGANVVLQEISAMRRFGVDAWLINHASHRKGFNHDYPDLGIPVIYGDGDLTEGTERLLDRNGVSVDAIVATSYDSFYWLPQPSSSTTLVYYIQDVEMRFFEPNSPEAERAKNTYLLRPEIKRVTKSAWNRDQILDLGGFAPVAIGIAVDVDRFYPRSDDGLDPRRPPHVIAMVRPVTPRRAPERTLRVLRRLKDRYGHSVEISYFGGALNEVRALGVRLNGLDCQGRLRPEEIAELLGRADLFLDLSDWQAMGLTALEAMASGAAVVVPKNGAAGEFCVEGVSGRVIDTQDEDECFRVACNLIENFDLRTTLRGAALDAATKHFPEASALKLLKAIWSD